jgi:hypothetical protein
MIFWPGISGITRCWGGFWRYMTVRVSGRTAVELERERNRATAAAIQLLPPGAELLEDEPGGRLRVIRMPEQASQTPVVIRDATPSPRGELAR